MEKLYLVIFCAMLAACGGGGDATGQESKDLNLVPETTDSNDTFGTAQIVKLGDEISGSLTELTDVVDYFKFSVREGDTVNISLSGEKGLDFDLYLYDENYAILDSSEEDSSAETLVFEAISDTSLIVGVDVFIGTGSYALIIGSTNSGESAKQASKFEGLWEEFESNWYDGVNPSYYKVSNNNEVTVYWSDYGLGENCTVRVLGILNEDDYLSEEGSTFSLNAEGELTVGIPNKEHAIHRIVTEGKGHCADLLGD